MRFGLAAALAFPLAVPLTYAIVCKVRIGDQLVGEAINGLLVIPLSRALQAINVPDFGFMATVAGSLILTLPYCLMVVLLYILITRSLRPQN
ncbi:MAG TPA: hypothetical protein VH120_21150, partial [Gemmataceae bacterium]|nr:hypothetical protein [Gemmataceae bacterium]